MKNNEVKKSIWHKMIKQPFLWIVIWIMIFFFLDLLSNSTVPFMKSLLEILFLGYFYITPVVISLLCVWAFIYGIRLLKQKGKELIAIFHIILSLIIVLFMIVLYRTILMPVS